MDFEEIVKQIDKIPEKIRWAIVSAVLLLILILYYVLFRLPAEENLAKLEAERAKLEREYGEKQIIVDDLANWQEDVRRTETELQEALKRLPDNIGYDNLIVIVPNFAKKNNLSLESFELGDEIPMGNYSEVPIELKLEGEFQGFLRFMSEIGEHPRIMSIKDVAIARSKSGTQSADPDADTKLGIEAALVTYRFREPAAVGAPVGGTK